MKDIIPRILAFVKTRENHFEYASKKYGQMQLSKLKAITKIRSTLEYYKNASISVQFQQILRLREQIFTIIPSDQSKYQGIRRDILNLLEEVSDSQQIQTA